MWHLRDRWWLKMPEQARTGDRVHSDRHCWHLEVLEHGMFELYCAVAHTPPLEILTTVLNEHERQLICNRLARTILQLFVAL
jgi:hypothetical protein